MTNSLRHRAYRSVHGNSLAFTYLLIVARHTDVALAGYFFVVVQLITVGEISQVQLKTPCDLHTEGNMSKEIGVQDINALQRM